MCVLMDGWIDVYMYAYVHKYVCISKIDIPEYNLLSMYSVKCMYVFMSALLALENQFLCSSLGNTTSPTPSFSQMSDSLYKVEAF